MRHLAFFCAVSASLAFAGCSTVEQVAGPLVTSGIDAVKTDPSLVPCLASEAAIFIGPLLGPAGSSIRGTNRKTVMVSRAACARAGGQVVGTKQAAK